MPSAGERGTRRAVLRTLPIRAFEAAGEPLAVVEAGTGRVVAANRCASEHLGIDGEAGTNLLDRVEPASREAVAERLRTAPGREDTERLFAAFHGTDGRTVTAGLAVAGMPQPASPALVTCVFSLCGDRARGEVLEADRSRILEMVARHLPLPQVMASVVAMVERQFTGAMVAVLIQDEARVRVYGGEGLPEAYRHTLAERPEDGGPVGQALRTQAPVMIEDLSTDQRWDTAAAEALAHGIRAAWILPFREREGAIAGALLLHHAEPTLPDEVQLDLLQNTLQLAKIAIEEHRTSERLHRQAYYDDLTGLPNRSLMHERLARAIEHAGNSDRLVVALLDLDEFKVINDSLGHATGDELLQCVAERLSMSTGEHDTVARLGGDEFVIILPLAHASDAADACDRLWRTLQDGVSLHGHRLSTAASIGVAMYPHDGARAPELLQAADTAMYAAKQAGRNCYQFHSRELNRRAHERMSIEAGLRRAIDQGELRAHYQPIVDGDGERILGVEALVRWQHPEQGLLTPAHFLEQAEKTDLVCEIDQWLAERVCHDLAWIEAQGHVLSAAVNASPRSIQRADFARTLLARLGAHGHDPGRYELEITENVLAPDVSRARRQIQALKNSEPALEIAIDDFGTGYASLGYLTRLPVDALKIDRSFVQEATGPEGPANLAIARSIAQLARNLGLRVVAEGVETTEQLELMRGLGCDRLQGFLFGAPMPVARLVERLQESAPHPVARAGATEQ